MEYRKLIVMHFKDDDAIFALVFRYVVKSLKFTHILIM